MTLTWEEAKANSDRLTDQIYNILEDSAPRCIADVVDAVRTIDKSTVAVPNKNHEGKYCQLILYPSKKWSTWGMTSMSISKYGLFD